MWNVEELKAKIQLYNVQTTRPTYVGLLCFLGVTTFDLRALHRAVLLGNEEALAYARLLDQYRMELERDIEERLVYQVGGKCDYKALQFIYGESKSGGVFREKIVVPVANVAVSGSAPVFKLGKNESGVKIDIAGDR